MIDKAILVDLDGTITDNTHRLPLIQGKWKRWDEYFTKAECDLPHKKEIAFVNDLKARGLRVILTSGRPERTRVLTSQWLTKHGVNWDMLFMRGDKDFRKNPVIKKEHLAKAREMGFEPVLGLDDHPEVVKMWMDEGVLAIYLERGHDYGS